MDVFLPEGFEPNLSRPQKSRPARAGRLRVKMGGVFIPVLRRWTTGFAVSAEQVPAMQGIVDLYDGAEHLYQCLIMKSERVQDEWAFTVKRADAVDYAATGETESDTHASG